MKFLSLSILSLMAAITLNAQTYSVASDATTLHWTGQKVAGAHEGFVKVSNGNLEMKDGKLAGNFTIDMTSMTCTDIEDAEYNKNLIGHLMADDFFSVEENPTATFEIKEANKVYRSDATHDITGDLTIKGKTNPISFSISIYGNKATATLKVDRTKYDVRYGSTSFFDNLQDKAIYDEFDLVSDLEF